MAVQPPRGGRPSTADLLQREALARSATTDQLIHALQHLNHPSRLADSPLCQLAAVRAQAATLAGYRFPRAHIVIQAVRRAFEVAWAELGETEDACCLLAVADALQGRSREESACKAGVSVREISRRRREAVDMIVDHLLPVLHGSDYRRAAVGESAATDERRPAVGRPDARTDLAHSGIVA